MTKTKIQTNVIFEHLNQTDSKIIIEQGGTRSGKTYNILMWIIFQYCETNTGKTITICRKTFPALRGTVMRDFFDILHKHQLYYEELRSRSTNEYIINGNRIEFISLSEPQRVRGRKRNLLFINECTELTLEDWQQLLFRTSEKIIIDYDPSEEFHWIYEKVITRDDATFFQTSYVDNPFLEHSLIELSLIHI